MDCHGEWTFLEVHHTFSDMGDINAMDISISRSKCSASIREDLKKCDIHTLEVHEDNDQIDPIALSGQASAEQIADSELVIYNGARTV